MTLEVGVPNIQDSLIVFVAQVVDIRRDNKQIVGAFVLKGDPLSGTRAKSGYCAIIDGKITIGVAEDSPLFDKDIAKKGYFFRQYPLVDNGEFVSNEPKNKTIRRTIGERRGEVIMKRADRQSHFTTLLMH